VRAGYQQADMFETRQQVVPAKAVVTLLLPQSVFASSSDGKIGPLKWELEEAALPPDFGQTPPFPFEIAVYGIWLVIRFHNSSFPFRLDLEAPSHTSMGSRVNASPSTQINHVRLGGIDCGLT
jgi:hypothetical protein